MKKTILTLALALSLFGVVGANSAWADRGHVHIGVGIGLGPYWGPWYYPYGYPYYGSPYYAPVVVERAPAQVYVEPQPVIAAPPVESYWYYCAASQGYYPYVKECPGGWQKVAPQPADKQ